MPPPWAEIASVFRFKSSNAAQADPEALKRNGSIAVLSRASRGIRRTDAVKSLGAGRTGRSRSYVPRGRGSAFQPGVPILSYSAMTCAPSSSSVAAMSRLARTTIAVVSDP